jgi:tripartite-type tricarboxylate transporter receptor subunit TctC
MRLVSGKRGTERGDDRRPTMARAGCAGLMILSAVPGAVLAQDACAFFSGKTVELVVPFNPGGGYDLYGRMVAAHMGEKLGADSMIVSNRPGAGGTLATNQTWNATPDGLTIQLTNTSGMLTSELGGAPGVGYQSAAFSWIGRVTSEADAITVGVDNDIDSLAAIREAAGRRGLRFGSTGIGADNYVGAQIISMVLGIDSDIVVGFSGAPEVFASMARSELDFFVSSYGSANRAAEAGSVRIIGLLAPEANPMHPDVDVLGSLIEDEGDMALVRAFSNVGFGGRALAGPPGMAEDRLQCLRDAYDLTMADPAFLADTEERGLPVSPVSGANLADVITGLMADPPEAYVELLREAYRN